LGSQSEVPSEEADHTAKQAEHAAAALQEDKNAGIIDVIRNDRQNIITGDNSDTPVKEDIASSEAATIDSQPVFEAGTSYEALCSPDHELLLRLKQFSGTLYEHSLQIGDLSCRAAKEIGVNDLLAKAGGLYHDIGKIISKNYIEEGLKLAEEYAFPKELRAILKEHNIKYDKPRSVEAAIVMLSDNVVSTIDYIAKTGDHKFSAAKIIDNIFQMRLDKGNFDATGLALKDFKKLKEFYQTEFSKISPEQKLD
jgi:putative nucleotidyltransferase with HDIG domain